jgi:hypothetical protein
MEQVKLRQKGGPLILIGEAVGLLVAPTGFRVPQRLTVDSGGGQGCSKLFTRSAMRAGSGNSPHCTPK